MFLGVELLTCISFLPSTAETPVEVCAVLALGDGLGDDADLEPKPIQGSINSLTPGSNR
jgi:hypothetical protein